MIRFSILYKLPIITLLCAIFVSVASANQADEKILTLEKMLMDTVEQVKDSVIAIELKTEEGQTTGSGSGVIVSADGLILTAAHVVDGKKTAEAILADGTRHKIKVLGMNRYKDAAVCRFISQDRSWPYTPMGDSDVAKVTEWVIAMGHGRGYDKTRSAPVRFGRIRAHNPGRFLTTNCPLIGGDSGGPLFNIRGEVIGINSSINGLAKFNVHAGVSGFKDDLARMEAGIRWGRLMPNVLYTPETPLIGIIWRESNNMYRRADPRPIVAGIAEGGPADKALLRPGDLILQVGEDQVSTQYDVMIALGRMQAGDTPEIIVKRGNELLKTQATLIPRGAVDAQQMIDAPPLRDTQDSPYLRDKDKPLLDAQINNLYSWAQPLAESQGETYIGLYDRNDNSEPLLNATIIEDGLALAPLSAFLTLPRDLLAWRPGIDAYPVELIGGYEEHDLAVLKVSGLKATQKLLTNSAKAKLGQFLAAVSNENDASSVIRLGIVSVEERNLRALLGVGGNEMQRGKGAILGRVARGNTAFRMGLKAGDVVTTFNGERVLGFQDLVDEIGKIKVGDEISVEYLRNGKRYTATDTIGAKKNESGRINTMDQLGRNSLSSNRDSFQTVIQSDILVEPEECGSPIFSLQGKFIGIAISDAGRNKSYIIPAHIIAEALQEKPTQIDRAELASNMEISPRPQARDTFRPRFQGGAQEMEEILRLQEEHLERFFQESQSSSSEIFEGFFEQFFGR